MLGTGIFPWNLPSVASAGSHVVTSKLLAKPSTATAACQNMSASPPHRKTVLQRAIDSRGPYVIFPQDPCTLSGVKPEKISGANSGVGLAEVCGGHLSVDGADVGAKQGSADAFQWRPRKEGLSCAFALGATSVPALLPAI